MMFDDARHPVRMALHGYGYIGRFHVLASHLNLASARADCPIIWDSAIVRQLDGEAAELARLSFPHVTDSWESLSHRQLDAMSIASPNDAHMEAFEYAVHRGLAVYCEKPISHSLEQAQAMLDMANGRDVVHQVALIYRFHPAVIQARNWLQSGRLGRVLTFRAELLHGGYLDPARPMSWRLQRGQAGGGAAMDLGIHLFDLLLLLLGPIQCVSATTRTFVQTRKGAIDVEDVLVDDWMTATLTMTSGATGTAEVSRVHIGRERDFIEIVCEGGVLHLPLADYGGAVFHPVDTGVDVPQVKSPRMVDAFSAKWAQSPLLNLHATSLAVFAARVRGGLVDVPVPTFADAVSAQYVVDAAIASGKQAGQIVTLC